ncbi:ClpP family protease [Corynebacterium glyciniphilum]|uniref:ClpP family protease n=1 Tax=Corynebacterium glyciniphilum TaxID=1404244 RepID=UPI0026529D20|nr:ATP-dependent Clp protease proteolytic subunit [Corynebacterium glyciniphilum]MDN6704593.1 ATP-dependent Clp protease proteolytic subunit [Corynebacterium glyciniphilum]
MATYNEGNEESSEEEKQVVQQPLPVDALIQNDLYKKRIVTVFGEVTGEQCRNVCAQMFSMVRESESEPITMLIDSPGGDLMAGMMVYDLMRMVEPPVHTVAMGLAASMGQFLLSAGEPGHRWIFPTARIMMHQPSSGIGGSAEDIRIQFQQHKQTREIFEKHQARNIGKSIEEIHRDSERDRWFTAEDACEYGIADKVMQKWSELSIAK